MSYFSYTESERSQISAGLSICSGIFVDRWAFNRCSPSACFFYKAQEKGHNDFKRKNSFRPSHCTSRLAASDRSVPFSSHSDVRRRLGCVFLRVTVLRWKPSREVKNSIPRTCVGKGEGTVRRDVALCTNSWVPAQNILLIGICG